MVILTQTLAFFNLTQFDFELQAMIAS